MSSSLAPGDYDVPGRADPSLQDEAGRRVSSLARHHARLQGARLPAHQHAIPLVNIRDKDEVGYTCVVVVDDTS
jgi:hypothetical protein